MSTIQRIVFGVVAVIITVVAVIALSSGSDERTTQADEPPATVQDTATPEPQEASPADTPTATPTPAATPAPKRVRVRDGEVVGGSERLTFEKGETARFSVSSDVAEEVHVHGYDIEKEVPAGGTARFAFRADIEGIFEVELHGSGLEIAQLRIEP